MVFHKVTVNLKENVVIFLDRSDDMSRYNFSVVEGATKYIRLAIYDSNEKDAYDLTDCDICLELLSDDHKGCAIDGVIDSKYKKHNVVEFKLSPDITTGRTFFKYKVKIHDKKTEDISIPLTGSISVEKSFDISNFKSILE